MLIIKSPPQFGLIESVKKDKAGRKLRKERKNRAKSAFQIFPLGSFRSSSEHTLTDMSRCLQSSAVLPRSRVPSHQRRSKRVIFLLRISPSGIIKRFGTVGAHSISERKECRTSLARPITMWIMSSLSFSTYVSVYDPPHRHTIRYFPLCRRLATSLAFTV